LPGEIEDLTLTKHCASMAYPDAVAIEAAAAKGKTDLSGRPQRGGARAQGSSSKRIKQSDTRPRNLGNVANPVLQFVLFYYSQWLITGCVCCYT